MKIARNLEFQIKKGQETEFTRTYSSKVLPLMKQQKGFEQGLTMVDEDKAFGLSLWSDKSSAEAYHASAFPKVVALLTPFVVGSPRLSTYQVAASTLPA